jgi:hypothetical protein
MSSDNEQDIADIVEQLQQLQLQQSVHLTRLAGISQRNTEREYFDAAADTPRELRVGDRVIINNPGVFQPKRGVIIKIGASRITVKPRSGPNIQRSPNNLILDTT